MTKTTKFPPVIITGGAAGIGLAIAYALARKSHPIALVDLSEEAAVKAAEQLASETGVNTLGVAADVADPAACTTAHDQIVATLGPAGVLVNNAGFMPPRKGWVEQIPHEDFQHMMDVHVGGAVNWCRLVMPAMRAAQFGRIINMSSANGVQPVPHRFTYVTAKKALRGLTEALALDCARAGITVNAISPGYILTDTLKERADRGMINYDAIAEHTPAGRWGKPEEIAHMAAFLADPESGYITGTTMVVDGGITIRGDPGENLNDSPFVPS
jgi:NAD(P)-dependent dehydrogenase (short-subunit alcohol dehydrogenase family)